MAALLAAVMGAMSSVFNSASTLVTLDFYKKLRPHANENAAREFRPRRHGRHGAPWFAVGSVHPLHQQPVVDLPAKRAGVYQPAHRRLLHLRHSVAAAERSGSHHFAARPASSSAAMRFVFEVLDKTRHYDSSAIRWLVDMNFLHYAIFMFVVCSAVLDRREPDDSRSRIGASRRPDVRHRRRKNGCRRRGTPSQSPQETPHGTSPST